MVNYSGFNAIILTPKLDEKLEALREFVALFEVLK